MLAERRFAILAFVFLILFWSSAFGAIKVSLEYAPPVLFAGTRTLLCGAVVTLAALVWGGQADLRREWPVYLLLAAFNVVLFMGLQTLTILYMPSGSAAVVIYLQPILVGLLSYLILGEQLSAAKVVGLVLGFSGVVVVSAGSLSGPRSERRSGWRSGSARPSPGPSGRSTSRGTERVSRRCGRSRCRSRPGASSSRGWGSCSNLSRGSPGPVPTSRASCTPHSSGRRLHGYCGSGS